MPPYDEYDIDIDEFDHAVTAACNYVRTMIEDSANILMALRGCSQLEPPEIPALGPYHIAQPLTPAPIVVSDHA